MHNIKNDVTQQTFIDFYGPWLFYFFLFHEPWWYEVTKWRSLFLSARLFSRSLMGESRRVGRFKKINQSKVFWRGGGCFLCHEWCGDAPGFDHRIMSPRLVIGLSLPPSPSLTPHRLAKKNEMHSHTCNTFYLQSLSAQMDENRNWSNDIHNKVISLNGYQEKKDSMMMMCLSSDFFLCAFQIFERESLGSRWKGICRDKQ